MVAAVWDRTARVWDLQGRELNVFEEHSGGVYDAAFSPDGQWVVTASDDRTARVWSADTLDTLLVKGCNHLRIYLVNHPATLAALPACQTPQRLRLAAPALRAEGDALAREGQTEGAIAQYEQANQWHPGLVPQPAQRAADLWAAQTAWATGSTLAADRNWEGALAQFQIAVRLDDTRRLDPEAEARYLTTRAFLASGRTLAREGDLQAAATQFQAALDLVPAYAFAPQEEAQDIRVDALLTADRDLARKGDIAAATDRFQAALDLDPSLDLNPQEEAQRLATSALIDQGEESARQGNIPQALTQFETALSLSPALEIAAASWDTLCFYGSVYDQTPLVFNACEQAVTLDPADPFYRRNRGIARALTNDPEGGIADFQFFIEQLDPTGDSDDIELVQAWITDLRAGKPAPEIFAPFFQEIRDRQR